MNQYNEMKENLKKEIEGYYMQLFPLKDMIAVEKDVIGQEEMERAPNFTMIILCALSDAYMIGIMRLYEKSESKEERTIQNLIKKCKDNLPLFDKQEEKQAEVRSKLEEFEEALEHDYISNAIKTLKQRRDKIYAHNDKKYFGEKMLEDKSYFKMHHVWTLCDFAEKVLKYISEQLSYNTSRGTRYDKDLRKLFSVSQN